MWLARDAPPDEILVFKELLTRYASSVHVALIAALSVW